MYLSLPRNLIVLIAALVLAGCTALPSDGPRTRDITSAESSKSLDFLLVDVDKDVAEYQARRKPHSFSKTFGKGRPMPLNTIGVGDLLAVSIWEAGDNGLFNRSERQQQALSSLQVDANGLIFVPYVGWIKASGQSPAAVQNAIEKALEGKAIQPQAMVQIKEYNSASVTVIGSVNRPGPIPLSVKGDQLLDVLARAGGPREAAHLASISVNRRGSTASMLLRELQNDPRQNIYLRPGDEIFVEPTQPTFTLFGAVNKPGRHPFASERVSIIEAFASGSGLVDLRADARGLFLFRYEPRAVADKIRPGHRFHKHNVVPIVYRFSLKDPQSFFFAQLFPVRNKDVFYVANAESIRVQKLSTLFRAFTSSVSGGADAIVDVKAIP